MFELITALLVLTLVNGFTFCYNSPRRTCTESIFPVASCNKKVGNLPYWRATTSHQQQRQQRHRQHQLQAFYENDDEDDDFDPILEYSIDSFLRGEYDRPFADDAPAPHRGLSPQETIEIALESLHKLDDPEPSHGAAVFMRFCVPLSRSERWGQSDSALDSWKQILRRAITPAMFASGLRQSMEFSILLDWVSVDVTEGTSCVSGNTNRLVPGGQTPEGTVTPSIAFVNAALYFGDGIEPSLIQFTLRKIGGVWLIDTARLSQKDLFID